MISIGIGKSRAYQLIGIANGTTTVEQIREGYAKADAKRRAPAKSVHGHGQNDQASTGRAVAVVERDEDRDDVLLEDGQLLAKAGFTEDDRRVYAVYKFIQALDADQRAGFFEPLFEDGLVPSNERVEVVDPKKNHRAGTGNDQWFTPSEYIERAREVLGEIELDPASCEQAQETVKAGRFFTEEQNGLEQEWSGRVWLNPPYSNLARFADKLVAEVMAKRVTAAVVLTHNYSDTRWFHDLASVASAMCFTRGWIKFVGPGPGELANPAQGQTFFYFGATVDRFRSVFADKGLVVTVCGNALQATDESAPGEKIHELTRANLTLQSELEELREKLATITMGRPSSSDSPAIEAPPIDRYEIPDFCRRTASPQPA